MTADLSASVGPAQRDQDNDGAADRPGHADWTLLRQMGLIG